MRMERLLAIDARLDRQHEKALSMLPAAAGTEGPAGSGKNRWIGSIPWVGAWVGLCCRGEGRISELCT